jgi:hypothetical protein
MSKKRGPRAEAMDRRLREMIIGTCAWRLPRPTMSEQEGDVELDATAHTDTDTSREGEFHPQLFSAEASRRRLGLDPISSH